MKRTTPEILATKSGKHVAIYYCTVGQRFATVAELRNGTTVLATTPLRPYGFTGCARADAIELAATLCLE